MSTVLEASMLSSFPRTSALSEHANKTGHHPLWKLSLLIETHTGTPEESRKLSSKDFTLITPTGMTESKFLERGYQRSINSTGDRYEIRPPREQLVVRPLGKPALTPTMAIEIHQSH